LFFYICGDIALREVQYRHTRERIDLPCKPLLPRIRINSEYEVLARANNLIVGRAAYETAVRLYPED
jgi:hypothetical protein